MDKYGRYERAISSRPWWPHLKYGALILLAGATAYVVVLAMMK